MRTHTHARTHARECEQDKMSGMELTADGAKRDFLLPQNCAKRERFLPYMMRSEQQFLQMEQNGGGVLTVHGAKWRKILTVHDPQ